MKERSTWVWAGLVVAVAVLAGCETIKGAQKDITNTVHNVPRWFNTLDAQFKDKLW